MCIFCKISEGGMAADFIFQDDDFIAIKDINPKAPIHILIIPKNHIESVNAIEEGDGGLVGRMIILAKKIAEDLQTDKSGYKLVFNVGRGGGQVIDHLHLHLLGGWNNIKPKIEV